MFVAFLGCSGSEDSTNCPQGFTGSDCSTKITPTKMFITKIVVNQYPLLTSNSQYWDTGEDTSEFQPDIVLALTFADGTSIVNDDIRTDSSGAATFQIVPTLALADVNEDLILFSVLDYDGGDGSTSDIMAQKYIQLYDNEGSVFPSVIHVVDVGQLLQAEIHVSYEW